MLGSGSERYVVRIPNDRLRHDEFQVEQLAGSLRQVLVTLERGPVPHHVLHGGGSEAGEARHP